MIWQKCMHSEKDFVILQLCWWLFTSTKHCSWNMVYFVVLLLSYFPSYNYQQDKSTHYYCWITIQNALKIATSNLYCKITLVWLDSSLIAVSLTYTMHYSFYAKSEMCIFPITKLNATCLTVGSVLFKQLLNRTCIHITIMHIFQVTVHTIRTIQYSNHSLPTIIDEMTHLWTYILTFLEWLFYFIL